MDSKKLVNGKKNSAPFCIDEKRQKQMGKKKMPMEKKKAIAGRPKTLKSKAKQGTSDNATKSGSKRKRTATNDIYDDVEAKFTVMERAERVLSRLEDETPCFAKCMLPSNVTYSFWLIIPKRFCSLHLPSQDSTITLVDEWGKEYKTNYLIDRHGLSGGWRGFSIAHRLLKGDILIFCLIEPCKLKVHIVRVHGVDAVNAALCLMNMDASRKRKDAELAKQDNKKRKRTMKYEESYMLDAPKFPDEVKEKGKKVTKSNSLTLVDQSENNIEDSLSPVSKGSEIHDHLIPADHRCSETSFLHDHPCKGVTCR
ncbi:hypothetical protein M9H77_20392 [Catharanthus roseus]|uniref:Uncharacterized protein n=2 Tax=Catharanthus roseus TaxID=4058 RepID=A0ACC0AKH0_CATRO|nr:hypothetical protein M9H77_20392 [Catharanthus roseus]QTJ02269.1 AP2/B3 type transcription factor [Catharanthus roseus]